MFLYGSFLFIFSIKSLEILAEDKLNFRNASYFHITKLVYNS